jgi:hypothetical protein
MHTRRAYFPSISRRNWGEIVDWVGPVVRLRCFNGGTASTAIHQRTRSGSLSNVFAVSHLEYRIGQRFNNPPPHSLQPGCDVTRATSEMRPSSRTLARIISYVISCDLKSFPLCMREIRSAERNVFLFFLFPPPPPVRRNCTRAFAIVPATLW